MGETRKIHFEQLPTSRAKRFHFVAPNAHSAKKSPNNRKNYSILHKILTIHSNFSFRVQNVLLQFFLGSSTKKYYSQEPNIHLVLNQLRGTYGCAITYKI